MENATALTMGQLLDRFPWARRALFQKFHIGGCASCAFSDNETLDQVCRRNGSLDPADVMRVVESSHAADEAMMLDPLPVRAALDQLGILDIRSAEEFEAVHLPGSHRLDQELMGEIMSHWQKDRAILIVDHTGSRCLDAAAFFAGHGFSNVRCLRGGIDAYAREADTTLPRYALE